MQLIQNDISEMQSNAAVIAIAKMMNFLGVILFAQLKFLLISSDDSLNK